MAARIITCAGCESIGRGLAAHSSNDDIVVWSCKNITALVRSLENAGSVSISGTTVTVADCQEILAEQLVAETLLLRVILERISSVSVSALKWSLRALGSFCRKNEANRKRLVLLGLGSSLSQICDNVVVKNEVGIAEALCWLVGNCSYPDHTAQSQLEQEGDTCNIVLTILHSHIASATTVQEALRALRNLCLDHEVNLRKCHDLGAAEICLHVCRHNLDESKGTFEVLQWVW